MSCAYQLLLRDIEDRAAITQLLNYTVLDLPRGDYEKALIVLALTREIRCDDRRQYGTPS